MAKKRFYSNEFTYRHANRLIHASNRSIETLLASLQTSKAGLTEEAAADAIRFFGLNLSFTMPNSGKIELIKKALLNPFYLLVTVSFIGSLAIEEDAIAAVIFAYLTATAIINVIQYFRYEKKIANLLLENLPTVTVLRQEKGVSQFQQIQSKFLVPGDIVDLCAGQTVPADLRLFTSNHLSINQSAITGESNPSPKSAKSNDIKNLKIFDLPNICLMGTYMMSGAGTGVVLSTGANTYFGSVEAHLHRIKHRSYLNLAGSELNQLLATYFIFAIPAIFLVSTHLHASNWQTISFTLALGLGLVPELLPIMVTLNLARGAFLMAKGKILAKNMDSIPSIGSIDVLCCDKTGTLTEDSITLEGSYDCYGKSNNDVLKYAYLNSHLQTGIHNYIDLVILQESYRYPVQDIARYTLKSEVPFDFMRKRSSVELSVLNEPDQAICKGAPEDVLVLCTKILVDGAHVPAEKIQINTILKKVEKLLKQDQRIIFIAVKNLSYFQSSEKQAYLNANAETGFTLVGYLAFVDPPIKDSALSTVRSLKQAGISIKILTGDNDFVTTRVANRVGLNQENALSGELIQGLSDLDLSARVEQTQLFFKLTPYDKMRVVLALRQNGHVVGFLGEGVNDSQALRASDVGICVSNGSAIAKNSADVILLDKDLNALKSAVTLGRKVFTNLIKYIRMSCSSNVGHIFSVLAASFFLPFLPITAVQALVQKLLNNLAQLGIPFDHVDQEDIEVPQNWNLSNLKKTMLFLGPVGSLRAIATFGLMWFVFRGNKTETQAIFQTGLFLEGVIAQSFIIHLNRTRKIPFFRSNASLTLNLTTALSISAGITLTHSSLGHSIGLVPLPFSYYGYLSLILLVHTLLSTIIKKWMIRRFGTF